MTAGEPPPPQQPPSSASLRRPERLGGWAAAGICAALLIAFAITSWSAARTKCATIDEPLHSTAAYLLTRFDDYRINPEDPPLWQRWAALAEPRDALRVNLGDARLSEGLHDFYGRWMWLLSTLYETPGNDPVAFVMRMRTMLILLGVALGALIAWWSWRLGGAVAAVAAAGLFALDPNFLAHAAVVKNDVAISLAGTALAYATWRAGGRLTWRSAAAVVVLAAVVLVTKFSAPLFIFSLVALLVLRALLPTPWPVFGRAIGTRGRRLAVAAGLCVVCAVAGYVTIWANYSFRFLPTKGGEGWTLESLLRDAAVTDYEAHHPGMRGAPRAAVEAWKPPAAVRAAMFLESRHVLPQTYLVGMIYTYTNSLAREAFLCGQIYNTGSVTYFPLGFLFKTPLATQGLLVLSAGSLLAGVVARRRRGERSASDESRGATAVPRGWTAACLWLPFAVVAVAALTSRLNIGVRHILPLYPVLFIAAGCGAARLWRSGRPAARLALGVLAVGLVAETAVAFPNYIPFFNAACGGPRGGLALLGDSNLDWGQDLPLLLGWQKRNPDRQLYLCYFGSVDPVYYGIRYLPLPGTTVQHDKARRPGFPTKPGVIAISATSLQGLYQNDRQRQVYGVLREKQEPLAVLGGTIYLYEYNPE